MSPARPAAQAALFGGEGPGWFTIAAHRPFLDDLAFGLDAALSPLGPEALSDAVVLTPTRRAARALGEAFLGVAGSAAVLLPQVRALGDLDEGEPPFEPGDLALDLPPAIAPRRRRFELARLVAANAGLFARPIDTTAALELADALAGFLDGLQIEEIAEPNLDALVDGELARHWQASAAFLRIATLAWPARLAELGLVDVNVRRIALLRALAERWRAEPPERPLVAAGSTGTAPATADLLRVIAGAPQGCVVLPGLDLGLADKAWDMVGEAHPQGAMRRLLARAGVAREAVRAWPTPESIAGANRGRARQRVVNEALRPAEATDDWLNVIAEVRRGGGAAGADPIAEGLQGLSLATARTEEEAAAVIAVLLRETLETPGRTAALVTPDAALARRVSARLARFGLRVDSSAGAPLAQSEAGRLVGLIARTLVATPGGQDRAQPPEPAVLLALAKHPRVRLGLDAEPLRAARRTLERRSLRGARPRDWDELFARLDGEERADALALAQALRTALSFATAPFRDGEADASTAARALAETVERLCRTQRSAAGAAWSGADGEAAAELLAAVIEDGGALPPCSPGGFASLMEALLAEEVVRSGGDTHPRLRILGAIEARLIRADRLVLAGLEEGVWPRIPEIDPFLSRPMRARLGLPPPERRTGLSAHDFAQAACAPEVVLVHTERRAGAPAVMSRWLWRLQTLAEGAKTGLPLNGHALAWARALDAPPAVPPRNLEPAPRPAPTPPVAVRPVELPVTGVETWVRDPYALYARRILRLPLMERPDAPMEARARGVAIHTAFERFARDYPLTLPDDAEALFEAAIAEELERAGMPDARMARERALARRLAVWSAAFDRERRVGAELVIEQQGRSALPIDGEPFTLTARADRIEVRGRRADIIDFKTGQPPSIKEVEAGFAPQLTLTGALIARGGFEALGPLAPRELVYVRLSGGRTPGEVRVVGGEAGAAVLAEQAMAGLVRRVRAFRRPERAYLAKAAPKFMDSPGDYDHLSRQWEWHVMGGADEAAEGGA